MKRDRILYNFALAISVALISVACSPKAGVGGSEDGGDPDTPKPPVVEPTEEYVAPEPPAEIDYAQLFSVDFVSNLRDEPLFEGEDYSAAISHVAAQSTSSIHIFDRADMQVSSAVPHTAIAVESEMRGVFCGEECGDGYIKGSAMICNQYIDDCLGVWRKDLFMASGCTIYVPATPAKSISILTSTLRGEDQVDLLFAKFKGELQENLIFVGKIENVNREAIEKHIRTTYKNFRLYTYSSDGDYSILAISPVGVVCRQVVDVAASELPHYIMKFEILD